MTRILPSDRGDTGDRAARPPLSPARSTLEDRGRHSTIEEAGATTPNRRQIARAYTEAVRALPLLGECLREEDFARAVARSVSKRFSDAAPDARVVARYVDSLHAAELGLAVACAEGHDAAWEHFITTYRPALYRAARVLTGDEATARELADSLWAELYGVGGTRASLEANRPPQSLLDYYHGRSRLTTWLRSVLSQRQVDRIRSYQRTETLDTTDEGRRDRDGRPDRAQTATPDPDRSRYVAAFRDALRFAVAGLEPRDCLRLRLYYVEELTLAQIGKSLGEHEATVSRRLAKVRRVIRDGVEQRLIAIHGLTRAETETCYRYVSDDPALDLTQILPGDEEDAGAAAPQATRAQPF